MSHLPNADPTGGNSGPGGPLSAMNDRAYPLPRPDTDPRYNFGLLLDVVKVLEEHGYPPITAGLDLVELQQALFRFLYVGGGDR